MKISIVCSSAEHPIYPLLEAWADRYRVIGFDVTLEQRVAELPGGDLLFLISCSELIDAEIRSKYCATLVVHASDLPRGRGWSPHIWQVLEGKDKIVVTLLEAEDKVDTGAIWAQTSFYLEGHELYDEINQRLFAAELELMDFAVKNLGKISPCAQSERSASYYRRRVAADSEIDPRKPLTESFNQLRVADSNRYPAFFYHLGYKYIIRIEKAEKND